MVRPDEVDMSALVAWRLAKLVGVILFASGLLGGAWASSVEDRRSAVRYGATGGFVLTWIAGWAMARAAGVSLGAPWISAAMLLSIASLDLSLHAVESEGRSPRAWVAVATFAGALGVMVLRPGGN